MSTPNASSSAPATGSASASGATPVQIEPASLTPALLGESPFWHPREQRLYYLDIPGHALFRWSEGDVTPERWDLNSEPGCIAPLASGGLLVAQRNGLWRMDPDRGEYVQLAPPPYDASKRRFNDGKADALGRLWVGTIDDARQPESALYCFRNGRFEVMQDGITSSNGLAWSPDGTTMYWADTKAHEVYQFDFDQKAGTLGERRPFLKFPVRAEGQPLSSYGGRPDGAAMDVEGCYWIAMMEGQQLHRFSPEGECLQTIDLPVRCATMPAFGGPDLRTIFVTTAREKRSPEELAAQPLAGCVLKFRVPVAGLPVQYARLDTEG
ncbi:SMP-30/gluconolactonase/LRE family protein [Roseateles terrae]|uniref:Sugar lactone lactonase YvrE n=1 Tax=Roseateles terrae TaxID=431060 RepID=A0ABR6GSM4_9BURK|nr:SMP-30/gluconolactonase/LRE family protein [Roseateles terrae]MBB3194697.1 sugar lactone lactonase YvrE [Roseateles terrae]OWQ86019.1 gluconolactonase [Roseateles terrae]